MRALLFSAANTLLPASVNLKMASMTDSSAAVVSVPQNDAKSFATSPVPTMSLPLFTVPAQRGIYTNDERASNSATLHKG